MVTAKREPAQEEPKLSKIPPWGPSGPQVGVLNNFGLLLGRLPFGSDNLLTMCFSICFATAQNHYFTL